MYAWGIVTAYLLTSSPPFSDCAKPAPDCHTVLEFGYGRHELAAAVAGDGLRPRVGGVDARARALLARAWAHDPAQRPPAAVVAAHARALAAELAGEEGAAAGEGVGAVAGARAAAPTATPAARPPPLLPWSPPPPWPPPTSPPTHAVTVSAACFETAGARGADRMEDASIVAAPPRGLVDLPPPPPSSSSTCTVALLAVFDGHRGAGCALHAASTLEAQVSAAARGGAAAPADALATALTRIDATWRSREAAAAAAAAADGIRPPNPCGAAAAVAVVWGGTLAVANCGDVRAVLGVRTPSGGLAPLRLTVDHAASSNPAEVARVRAAGGELVPAPDGSLRVAPVGLALTRSLGDADARASGVIAEPFVATRQLTPGDAVIVIASDGLWDVATDGEAVAWIADTVKHPAMAAKRLATEAVTRGSQDNVAVVVAYLEPVTTVERVFGGGG